MQRREFLKAGATVPALVVGSEYTKPELGIRIAYVGVNRALDLFAGKLRIVPPAKDAVLTGVWTDYQSNGFGLRFQSSEWCLTPEGCRPEHIVLEFISTT